MIIIEAIITIDTDLQLRVPNAKDFEELEELVTFNEEEKSYFEEMQQRCEAHCGEDAFKKIDFYLNELKETSNKFGDRVAVKRRLTYALGHAHEWLGTHNMEDCDPLKRSEMFEKAILCYWAADQTVGFFTDYSFRQSESWGGAAHFRRKAGINNDVTTAYGQMGIALLHTVLGGITGGGPIYLAGPNGLVKSESGDAEEILANLAKKHLLGISDE